MPIFTPYTKLAEKILRKYPQEYYPKLCELAHRILHERSAIVKIPGDNVLEIDQAVEGSKSVRNIAKNVVGTNYAKTTLWNEL